MPGSRDEFPDGALCELLLAHDIYDADQSVAAASYGAGQLKVLCGTSTPKYAKHLVGPTAWGFLEAPWGPSVRAESDLVGPGPPARPHWGRDLAADRALQLDFFRRLGDVGLLSGRRRASCHS